MKILFQSFKIICLLQRVICHFFVIIYYIYLQFLTETYTFFSSVRHQREVLFHQKIEIWHFD